MRLSEKEREELRALSKSDALRRDMAHVAATRHNPLVVDGVIDPDRVVEFLTQYNEFLNHPFKVPRPFIETNMKL
ncbi:hypothetical protein [Geomonas anaerohicana]|uniref:Uncharacterized protein n=1 Tax=Geomonas anaerohicana TaxID=2798583 RepID=A0ABS0YDL9_9BACT|nr:hypothetical protein [Geomonas anaerohicana]MBJ6750398.1 hypothetical protein [Geomonas anaerohicana]